jgi:hypothetical protein
MHSQYHHLGVVFVCNKLDAAFCNVLYDYFPSALRQMKVRISFPLREVKTEDYDQEGRQQLQTSSSLFEVCHDILPNGTTR